jgi:hypothetical protein
VFPHLLRHFLLNLYSTPNSSGKQARMARFDLPSKQADGTFNWVELADLDDLMGEDLLIIHRAVKIKSGPGGETEYSPREMDDDRANAFLGRTITAWSFPAPIPSKNNLAAADIAISRAMKLPDYAALLGKARKLLAEIDALEAQDPKSSPDS